MTAKKGDELNPTSARRQPGDELDYPIVLLADENSASGAEIVLGALQKNHRGIVLGTKSFGKGSVQQLQSLRHGAQLKITVSEYLIPGNISIQETGVTPDVFAQPIVLNEDYTGLFPEDRSVGERDYDTHIIVSKYKREEHPVPPPQVLTSPSGRRCADGRRTVHRPATSRRRKTHSYPSPSN